jgi:hypothetical protein
MVDSQRPTTVRHNLPSTTTAASALPLALLQAHMVFARRDEAKPPLTLAYAGTYEVLERSNAFFKLQIGDKVDIVTMAHLKASQPPPFQRLLAVVAALCCALSPLLRLQRHPFALAAVSHSPYRLRFRRRLLAALSAIAARQTASVSPLSAPRLGGRCSNDSYECRHCTGFYPFSSVFR